MKKLLIAAQSDVILRELSAALQEQWEIHTCVDGCEAIDILRYEQPEALVIDLGLPKKNGIAVLAECFPDLPTAIVAITTMVNPFIEQHAARWGVDYIFQTPIDVELLRACLGSASRLQEIAAKRVAQHLRVLGVNAEFNGYYCLLLAIPFLREDFSRHMHKEVYVHVAEVLRMDPRTVERAIRTAILSAWKNHSPEVWAQYFPVSGNGRIECPKNKEFVVSLAQRI